MCAFVAPSCVCAWFGFGTYVFPCVFLHLCLSTCFCICRVYPDYAYMSVGIYAIVCAHDDAKPTLFERLCKRGVLAIKMRHQYFESQHDPHCSCSQPLSPDVLHIYWTIPGLTGIGQLARDTPHHTHLSFCTPLHLVFSAFHLWAALARLHCTPHGRTALLARIRTLKLHASWPACTLARNTYGVC